jgi:hypothetical protein
LVGCGKNRVDFIEVKPPQKIGEEPAKDSYEELNHISINISNSECWDLLDKLKLIKDGKQKSLKVKEYTLNFSKYNIKSIEVVEKYVKAAIPRLDILALAC